MPVFLNRNDAIVADRELIDDSVHHFDNRSMLLGPRDRVLAELEAKEVGFVAAWSDEVRAHVKEWGLRPVAGVGSYTIYKLTTRNESRNRPRRTDASMAADVPAVDAQSSSVLASNGCAIVRLTVKNGRGISIKRTRAQDELGVVFSACLVLRGVDPTNKSCRPRD